MFGRMMTLYNIILSRKVKKGYFENYSVLGGTKHTQKYTDVSSAIFAGDLIAIICFLRLVHEIRT